VHSALRLMYAGFAATVAALVTSLMVLGRYTHDATVAKNLGRTAAQNNADTLAGVMALAVIADILGLICWVVVAIFCRRGRGWTRVTGTVLLGVYTVVMLILLVRSHNDPGARFTTLLTWAIGIAAVIPLWSAQARDFFSAWRRQ
jgi:hypothetical protein